MFIDHYDYLIYADLERGTLLNITYVFREVILKK